MYYGLHERLSKQIKCPDTGNRIISILSRPQGSDIILKLLRTFERILFIARYAKWRPVKQKLLLTEVKKTVLKPEEYRKFYFLKV